MNEIFNAKSLTHVLAKYANVIGSTNAPEANGARVARYPVVQSKGKLMRKNENLMPLGI